MNNGYRILLTDDDARTVAMVKECLELSGYNVAGVTSGAQCLEFLGKERADLLILDANMPQLDGHAVLGKIRENPRHADLPIIVLSGNDSPTVKSRSLDLGADDYITKPFHYGEFMSRIKALLRRYHRFRAIESAMSGQLSEVPISMLIQTLSLNGRSATISLPDENASIVFKQGRFVNALFREYRGVEALMRLNLGATGRFMINFGDVDPDAAPIHHRTEYLMLDLAHQLDQIDAAIRPVPSIDAKLMLDSVDDAPEPMRGALLAMQPLSARRLLAVLSGHLVENAQMLALLYGLGTVVESPSKT